LIIFDASALVSAALKADSVPERALLRAEEVEVFALSAAVDGEIAGVLNHARFARAIPLARRERVLEILRRAAVWFEPTVPVTDCRDPKDNKYLELALAAIEEGMDMRVIPAFATTVSVGVLLMAAPPANAAVYTFNSSDVPGAIQTRRLASTMRGKSSVSSLTARE
jgi:predicted nucleic acid-binding protein